MLKGAALLHTDSLECTLHSNRVIGGVREPQCTMAQQPAEPVRRAADQRGPVRRHLQVDGGVLYQEPFVTLGRP
jgi:hypothetical protein